MLSISLDGTLSDHQLTIFSFCFGASCVCFFLLPSLKLTYPLKMDGWKTSFLLGWPIFRGYVSFREGKFFLLKKSTKIHTLSDSVRRIFRSIILKKSLFRSGMTSQVLCLCVYSWESKGTPQCHVYPQEIAGLIKGL